MLKNTFYRDHRKSKINKTFLKPYKEIKRIGLKNTNSFKSMLYLKQEWTNEIKKLAKQEHCEYQVFYNALQIIWKVGDEDFVLNYPLVLFSHEQNVSTASIQFDLNEVEEKTEEYNEITSILASNALEELRDVLDYITTKVLLVDDYKTYISTLNTIHRHPTGCNTFSSIDLKRIAIGEDSNEHDRPGVVYVLDEVKTEAYTFATIMHHKEGGNTGLYETLAHKVTGSVKEGTLSYDRGDVFVYFNKGKRSLLEERLQLYKKDSIIDHIGQMIDDSGVEQTVVLVDDKHIKELTYDTHTRLTDYYKLKCGGY